MKTLVTLLPLFVILMIGFFLRFYQLGTNPPSLTWDEVSWGYNAYSLLTTGKDEFGKSFPIDYLESFGDFKPPVYAYLTVIPVAVFGLNEFATRFPSAFLGTLTVLLTYFLTKRIFFSSEEKEWYALFAALFLAVSPWYVNLSRAAFEANAATFFIIFGLWIFFYGIQKNPWLLILSALSFVLSLYAFNTARVVVPLLVVILLVLFYKELRKHLFPVVCAVVFAGLVLSPSLPFLFSDHAQLRYKEVNIFSDPEIVLRANQHIENSDNAWWAKIVNNRRVFYAREYIKHYFDNLSPSFLFIKGDGNPKFSTQQVGQLYLWDFPFLIAGALLLFRKREGYWKLLPLWFLIGILPAAAARETPHALRIETVLPIPQMLVAYGFVNLLYARSFYILRWKMRRSVVGICLLVVLFINVGYYLHFYYAHYPRVYSGEWQYGYKEAMAFVGENKQQFDKVFVTTALGRPYIYYLFYVHITPQEFQSSSIISREALGFVTVKRVGNVIFERDFPKSVGKNQRVLYINTADNVPENAQIIKKFNLLNGDHVLVAYTI